MMESLNNEVYDGDLNDRIGEKRAKGEEILCKYCLQEHISEDPLNDLMLFMCMCNEGVHY